jgi:hypothetical protein
MEAGHARGAGSRRPWRGAAKPLRASDARAAFLRLERSPSDWNRQLTVSFRRKTESITTGTAALSPFYRHPSLWIPACAGMTRR